MSMQALFIEKLTHSQHFSTAKQELMDFWDGDEVPINCALSDFAVAIVHQLDNFSLSEKMHIFATIEEGINSEDKELSTAVATGLIEALDSTACNDAEKFAEIKSMLGEKSSEYLENWQKFLGVSKL